MRLPDSGRFRRPSNRTPGKPWPRSPAPGTADLKSRTQRPQTRAAQSGHRRFCRGMERLHATVGGISVRLRHRRGVRPITVVPVCRDRAWGQPSQGKPQHHKRRSSPPAGRHALPGRHPGRHMRASHGTPTSTPGARRTSSHVRGEGPRESGDVRVYHQVLMRLDGRLYRPCNSRRHPQWPVRLRNSQGGPWGQGHSSEARK